jgi:outer membrane protein OmpA-like peptidoglycan-associated protein
MPDLVVDCHPKGTANMKHLACCLSVSLACLASLPADAAEVDYVQPPQPYKTAPFLKTIKKGPVDLSSKTLQIPMITWAADGVTILANNGFEANPNSNLAKALGMNAKLSLVDDFDKQVQDYITGKSPFLRGTMGMVNHVSEALTDLDPALAPVIVVQLSWSTGADGFVGKGIKNLSELKGKTIVIQAGGPHIDLLQVLLEDAGLKAGDVNVKYVSEITLNPDVAKDGKAHDPASALRNDPNLAGAACIIPDMAALTSGKDGGVSGAKSMLSTRTASRVIADVYAVRKDFFDANRGLVKNFVLALLKEQALVQKELDNIALKKRANKAQVAAFKKRCIPLSKTFLADETLVNDYIMWLGVDLQLAGYWGNLKFFGNDKNPVGFKATCERVQNYFKESNFMTRSVALNHAGWNYQADFFSAVGGNAAKAKVTESFGSIQDVRNAANSKGSNQLFKYTFKFPAKMATLRWQDYEDVFKTMHEKVTRYGGAVVQLRGHADNFFNNFCEMKRSQRKKTYEMRVGKTSTYASAPLPAREEVVNSATLLSYTRAFAVKRAYAAYLVEKHGMKDWEIDLSRFDVKGMGISDPLLKNPLSADERTQNMRGEMVIIAAESEVSTKFDFGDF